MAVTRKGRTITMTADDDALTGIFFVNGVTIAGTGQSSGNRVRLTDTAGDVIADYYTVTTTGTENADLWNGAPSRCYHGLKLEDFPGGGLTLTVFLE